MKKGSKLTNLQSEILKVFSFELPDDQLVEIKNLLADYFAKKASTEIDDLWNKNGWNNKKMENWSQEHMRTKYE